MFSGSFFIVKVSSHVLYLYLQEYLIDESYDISEISNRVIYDIAFFPKALILNFIVAIQLTCTL